MENGVCVVVMVDGCWDEVPRVARFSVASGALVREFVNSIQLGIGWLKKRFTSQSGRPWCTEDQLEHLEQGASACPRLVAGYLRYCYMTRPEEPRWRPSFCENTHEFVMSLLRRLLKSKGKARSLRAQPVLVRRCSSVQNHNPGLEATDYKLSNAVKSRA